MTTILITGANRGIGLEFIRQYATENVKLIACCREPAKATALNAIAAGGKVRVLTLDVGDPASAAALARVLDGEAIDILINNAGISGPQDPLDAAGTLHTLKINSVGPLLISQTLHENLKRGHDKKLVTITSVLGSTAENGGGMYAYRASKAAVNNFMVGLSKDWAKDGISVGIFHPGWVQTDMGGKGAPVTPEQSVSGLRQRIAELNPKNSGTYCDYTGKEIAW
jgi:NAD(P)-dependent dehydrogenase (short-subunit alcohol dehydrogenase family)